MSATSWGDVLTVMGGGVGQDLDVSPNGAEAFDQVLSALIFQILQWIHPEPHQQGVGRGEGQALAPQLPEGLLKVGVAGEKPLPLFLGPNMIRLKPQSGLELGEAPLAG